MYSLKKEVMTVSFAPSSGFDSKPITVMQGETVLDVVERAKSVLRLPDFDSRGNPHIYDAVRDRGSAQLAGDMSASDAFVQDDLIYLDTRLIAGGGARRHGCAK